LASWAQRRRQDHSDSHAAWLSCTLTGTAKIFGSDIRGERKSNQATDRLHAERDSFISKMSCIHFVRFMAELSGLPPRALERAHEALFFVAWARRVIEM
jgi:ABC-type multidrug transport system ATPase subunit